MPRFPSRRLRGQLAAADTAATNAEKGRALEEYICTLFATIPGIDIVERNALNAFHTEELDIALWNDGHHSGLRFLVECKNWSAPVGSNEVSYFAARLHQRGCDHGFLIAANGVTGTPEDLTAAHFQLATALASGIRIVVLTRQELEAVASASELCILVKRKLCQLVVSGTAA